MTDKEVVKNAFTCHDRLNKISSSVYDPKSALNIDALLDCMSSVAYELDQKAATNSKTLSVVLDRLKQSCKLIQSSRVNINDFSILKVLGKGAFGKVSLVRHNETDKIYALKSMNKYEMVKRDEALCLWEEREIMALSNSDFLVRDEANIYMVMEFVQGGDMVHYMNNCDIDEDSAKFYLAELSLALNFLHDLGFIHRDVKPDNMLLDQAGHLKLCDFGTCIKMNEFGKVACAIAVGTPDYIAPEVLNSQNNKLEYGREVDWWSAGIFLYEFLVGDTPFYAESYVGTYMNILNYKKTLKFPTDIQISEDAKAMICGFLTDTEIRLGYKGIDAIKAHGFFKDVSWSWDTIRNCPPPVVPTFAGESDASYFESNVDDDKLNDQAFSKPPVGGYHYPFIGFSFNPDFVSTFGAPTASTKTHVDDHAVEDLKKRLSDKIDACGNMSELLESKSHALQTANAKIDEFTQALNASKEEQIKSLAKIKELENHLDLSTQDLKKMEVQLKFMRISDSDTKKRYEELLEQVGPLKQSLDTYKTQQASLEATLADLTQQLNHSKGCYDQAVSDYQQLNNTHQTLLQEVDSIKLYFACNTLEKLKAMVETTQNKNREMCAKLKNAEEEVKNYEEMFKNKTTVEDSTRAELNSKNKKLLLDVATLQMLSDSLRSQISDLNTKNTDLMHSLAASQQESKETHMRLNEINSKLVASTQVESRLNAEKKLLVEKEIELQGKLEKSLELLRSFEKRITSFDEQLSYAEIKVNTQAKKIENLENDMNIREQNIASLNKEIENLQKQDNDSIQVISTQSVEISDLKCSIEKLEAQLALLSIDFNEPSSPKGIGTVKLNPDEIASIHDANMDISDVKTQYLLLKKQLEDERVKFEKVIETERTLKGEAIRKLKEVLNDGNFPRRLVSNRTQKNQPLRMDRKLEQTYKQLQMDYNKISDENAEMKKKYDTKISELNTFILDLQSTIERMKMERMDEDRLRSQNYDLMKSSKGSDIDSLSKADQVFEIKRAVLSYPSKSGKTGRKVNWTHVMAVLTNQELTIYSDLEEVQKPLFIINISMMYYVRAISHNDLIRGLPADIPKIFQIIYNEDSDTSAQSSSDVSSDKCTIINNHQLINIQYHMPATCDICGKGLWGFIKTSFAMECKNCHFKCHREHANETKAFPPCRDYENRRMAKEILLKTNSVSEQKYWIETLLRLMKSYSAGGSKKGTTSKQSTGSSNQSLQDLRSAKQ